MMGGLETIFHNKAYNTRRRHAAKYGATQQDMEVRGWILADMARVFASEYRRGYCLVSGRDFLAPGDMSVDVINPRAGIIPYWGRGTRIIHKDENASKGTLSFDEWCDRGAPSIGHQQVFPWVNKAM